MAMVIVVTIPLLSPAVVKWAGGATSVRRFGWALSVRNLVARLATTSVAVSALAVSVSMLFGITIMVGSFRQTLTSWLGTTIRADIYVTAESWRRGGEEATLSNDLVADLATMEGVAAVDRLRQLLVHTHDRRIAVAGVDIGLSTEAAAARFDLLAGDREVAFAAVQRGEALLVSEPLARKAGLSVGDHLQLPGLSGVVNLPITGVFHDYASDGGTAILDIETFARLFGPGEVQSVALYLDPDRDPERMVDLLMARFEDAPLSFRSNRRLREESLEVFDQTFAITRILQLMAMLVAVTGITLTLVVLARERVSELALFRALGARRRQIFRLFMGEGLCLGVLGVAMGALGGIAFALILIFGINRAYFGWTIKLHWPLDALARDTLLILLAAVAASVYPALRASGTPAGELNREDL